MSAANSTAEALSPTAKKAMYLSHFTPSMMQPETLHAMLVQRGPLLQRTVESVVHSVKTTAKHHHLFVGPRGIGKTHLISLIHHQISQNPAVKSKAMIAWMREEEWGVTSFMELILRILRTLDQTHPELGIEAQTQALYDLSIAQAEEQATQMLLQAMRDKTLVILLENLDDLFNQLKPTSQKQLRGLIQNHPQFVLVATTPSLFTAVTSQNSPFYGFFDIDPLEELNFEEVVELLEKVALERGDARLAAFIQSTDGHARIRAVHHLAEGNPRIYIIFAQFLSKEALDELVQAFIHMLDELTPYYQSRMKELSGQQRKIIEYLVQYRGAATVKQIAKSCFITQQVCSGQLKKLRENRTARSIEKGRESYYELAEPLMRLCMDVKNQKGSSISMLVDLLRIWYREDELHSMKSRLDLNQSVELRHIDKAIEELKKSEDPKSKAIIHDLNREARKGNLNNILDLYRELKGVGISGAADYVYAALAIAAILDQEDDVTDEAIQDFARDISRVLMHYDLFFNDPNNRMLAIFSTSLSIYKKFGSISEATLRKLWIEIEDYKSTSPAAMLMLFQRCNIDDIFMGWFETVTSHRSMSKQSSYIFSDFKILLSAVRTKNWSDAMRLPIEIRKLIDILHSRNDKN